MTTTYIKHNPLKGSQTLIHEAQGLEVLRQALPANSPLRVVEVLKVSQNELHLENIDSRMPLEKDYLKLAQGLALIHQSTQDRFGLDYENYIGLSTQVNTPSQSWGDFFLNQRLRLQAERLMWKKEKESFLKLFDEKAKALSQLFNQHNPQPGLIHGDLWNGNVLFDHQGPVLIDPAVSYSDPECDLAMTRLFGGFPDVFYQEYRKHSLSAIPSQLEELHQIYNLYHLLNHANLFGTGYLPACRKTAEVIRSL